MKQSDLVTDFDFPNVQKALKLKEQCSWKCPKCWKQCGGVSGHAGPHQCPEHYIPEKDGEK